mmetsp:Transcript_12028/g.19953  ORF Transcript_12028/g.19953 Transcript_12028/m.19953 type:complete len:491 (-) Transcript_12028:45-1517(-)|eukprot:CAMPEP_0119010998 /NCGR_PEP_ID=MMETSP1176-20130426/5386_1 /TAXON_ID=265551 /ORGANISM="Synedropsis recta cf, Strain CCMP1620" /LENGTH=490 /DNA_ID=CAMNT_0006963751 /DNA_START=133 /DNA_END=1605 /DNA_ORIENTATION=+
MSGTQEVGPIFGEGEGPAQSMLRSPTVIIASIGLWGMNIYFYRKFKLDYVHILNLDLMKEREAIAAAAAASTSSSGSRSNDGELLLSNSNTLTTNVHNSDDFSDGGGEYESPSSPARMAAIPFGSRITGVKCVGLSFFLLILLHLSEYLWVTVHGGSSIGAVFFFYSAFIGAIVFPLTTTRWVRIATVLVLQRTYELINPRCHSCVGGGPRPIPFIDVFYADAMCSLSKVFFDWGMLFHMASHYPDPVPKALDTILIPSFFAAIPYLIRARQCLIMHTVGCSKRDPKRYQHLLNALKYATSIFPICLSAYQQTLPQESADGLESTLIVLLIINASYALSWDIIMDWGMFQDPTVVAQYACAAGVVALPDSDDDIKVQSCGHALMRPKLRFGVTSSAAIAMADTVLRFSWLLRFRVTLFPSKDHFVLATQLMEIFRRGIWNLLRVEWESIKHTRARQQQEDEDDEIAPLFKPPPSLQMSQMSSNNNGLSPE